MVSFKGSHHSSPEGSSSFTQRSALAEDCIHKSANHAQPRARHLKDAEDHHTLLIEDEIPVTVHLTPSAGRENVHMYHLKEKNPSLLCLRTELDPLSNDNDLKQSRSLSTSVR